MRAGKIVEIGDAEQITSAPKHEYTKELLRAVEE
jgi:ABC-type dipeptide/oligopeptide/nickel transport system ATPase component